MSCFVCISHELTSEKIIRNLKPDFYCKGTDYSKDEMKFDKNLIKDFKLGLYQLGEKL